MPTIKKRDIAVAILLSIVTCGIYSIYWFIKMTDETNYITDQRDAFSGGVAFLLTLVTCGIYGYVWAYKMGDAYDRLDQRAANTGVIYLVLSLLGLSIVTYALLQDQINKHLPTDPTNPSLQPPTDSAP